MSAISQQPKPKCDVCSKKPRWKGLRFFQCKTCYVGVHAECYGIDIGSDNGADISFECWACQAVGKRFEVEDRDPTTGQRVQLLQQERPKRCELCSVHNGIHAMHPLFDNHGMSGRQIQCKDKDGQNSRLAWGHTLCCALLGAKDSLLYGCLQDGSMEGDEDEEEDDRSINPQLSEIDDDTSRANTLTHYVYCLPKNGKHNPWTRVIAEKQGKLRCTICGTVDKGSLRIPLQCSAGNEDEFEGFREFHTHLPENFCTQALHVGCARWTDANIAQRAWFFPGSDNVGGGSQPVSELYCSLHALGVHDGIIKTKSAKNKTPASVVGAQAGEAAQRRESNTAVRRNSAAPSTAGVSRTIGAASKNKPPLLRTMSGSSQRLPSPASQKKITSPSVTKNMMSASAASRACETQKQNLRKKLLKRKGGDVLGDVLQKSSSRTMGSGRGLPPPPLSVGKAGKAKHAADGKTHAINPFARAKDTSKIDKQILDKDSAQPIAKPHRGALLSKLKRRVSEAEVETKNTRQKTLHDEVYQDVVDEYLAASSKEARTQCLKGKRKLWKRKSMADMNGDDFDSKIWMPVRDQVKAARRRSREEQGKQEQQEAQQDLGGGGKTSASDTVDLTLDDERAAGSTTKSSYRRPNPMGQTSPLHAEVDEPQEDTVSFAHSDDHDDRDSEYSPNKNGQVQKAPSPESPSLPTPGNTAGDRQICLRRFDLTACSYEGNDDNEYPSDQEHTVGDISKPESRWAHLSVGPVYNGELFSFQWDSSIEEI